MNTAVEVAKILQGKRNEFAGLIAKHDTGKIDSVTGCAIYDWNPTVAEEMGQREAELNDLQDKFDMLTRAEMAQKNAEQMARLNEVNRRYTPNGSAASLTPVTGQKSLGQRFVESYEFKNRHQMGGRVYNRFDDLDFRQILEAHEFKTLMTTTANGYAPDSPRTNIVVPYANRTPRIMDFIPQIPTTVEVVKWMEETTFTNNASMTGEAYTKPESALAYTERSATVRKIAHWIPITKEQMDDVDGFMSLLDNDMVLMLRLKQEDQIINGTGVGQEITGFLNLASIQSNAFSVNNIDTVFGGITKVGWTGFANVSAIFMNPTNWQTTRLIKGATNQDYIMGHPQDDTTPRLFGIPVTLTPVVAAGTGLLGDFQTYSELRLMRGIEVDVSDSHSTYFVENKLAVRAEMRMTLVVKRQAAFCKLTSLT